MEDEEILDSKVQASERSAEGVQPAEDTSTPTETQEAAPVEVVIPEKERKNREAARSFFSAEMLAQEEVPEDEIIGEEENPLEETPLEGANQPQQEVQQAASEEEKPATPAEPVAPIAAVADSREGWPNLNPRDGFDEWGNELIGNVPYVKVVNEEGVIELVAADPRTGLQLLTEDQLEQWAEVDPKGYAQHIIEEARRLERVEQTLVKQRQAEVVQTHAKLKQNGMPESVISAIHTRAEQMLQPLGGLVAPGIYQQAILGATAEMLAYGGDGLIDLAKAIIANHEATVAKPATPTQVQVKAEVSPASKPAPARLATGGIGATGGAAPVKTAPVSTKEYPPVDAATMAELNRLGMTLKDWYES